MDGREGKRGRGAKKCMEKMGDDRRERGKGIAGRMGDAGPSGGKARNRMHADQKEREKKAGKRHTCRQTLDAPFASR